MTTGIVQSKNFSKSGSAMFKIGGQTYFVSRNVSMQGLEPNANIEFEWEEFGDDRGRGRPRTITKWRPVQQGQASNGSQNRSNGASQPSGPAPDAMILPFISNTIAHAIQAGLIKAPAELTQWVLSAKAAMNAKPVAERKPQSMSDPEFDDEIPESAYQGMPGPHRDF